MSSTAHRGDQLKPRKRSQASPLTVCDAQSAPRDEGRVDLRGFRVVACVPWTDVAFRACILLRALGADRSQRLAQTTQNTSNSFRIEGSSKVDHEYSPGTVVAQPIEVHAMSFWCKCESAKTSSPRKQLTTRNLNHDCFTGRKECDCVWTWRRCKCAIVRTSVFPGVSGNETAAGSPAHLNHHAP